jgi:hypothetical protein
LKFRLPDDTCLNMSIFACGAVLLIIKQKGLVAKCRKLGKAVVRQSKALKNILEAAGSKETVL